MSTIDRLIEEAGHLPADEKLALASRVLVLTEPAETETVLRTWDLEIRDRILSYDHGTSPARAASDVFHDLDSRLTK